MKRLIFLFLALAAILPAMALDADAYLTFGVNDTLRVCPSPEDSTQSVMVRMHTDARFDMWNMTLTLPQGMSLVSYARCDDMLYIPYWDYQGELSYCSASLMVSEQNGSILISSGIYEYGYFELNNTGRWTTYGYVKWEAGDYDRMFDLVFKFDGTLPADASISVKENLSSSYDMRGASLGTIFKNMEIYLLVVYGPGDVDGDGRVNIADVSALIDLLLAGTASQSEEVLRAADVNGDGIVNIADVSELIDRLLKAA